MKYLLILTLLVTACGYPGRAPRTQAEQANGCANLESNVTRWTAHTPPDDDGQLGAIEAYESHYRELYRCDDLR